MKHEGREVSMSQHYDRSEVTILNAAVHVIKNKTEDGQICGLAMMIEKSTDFSEHVNTCINSLGMVLAKHGDKKALAKVLEGVMIVYAKQGGEV